jgi:hypothetical protein
MVRPQVPDEGEGLQIWRIVVADSRQRVILQLALE